MLDGVHSHVCETENDQNLMLRRKPEISMRL